MHRVALLTALLLLSGCAVGPKLADPAGDTSGLGVVSMSVTVNTLLFGPNQQLAADFTIARLRPDGTVEKEITSAQRYKTLVLFENLEPGRYQVVRSRYVQQTTSAPTTTSSASSGGVTVSSSSSYTITSGARLTFEPDVVTNSVIEVPAGRIVYLGDYTARVNQKIGFPGPRYEMEATGGARTDEGKRKAYEMLKETYGDSPWLKRPLMD